jgi:Melibiase
MDRRAFLKRSGILVAAPLAGSSFGRSGVGEQEGQIGSLHAPPLQWGLSGGKALITLGDQRVGDSLCPGYFVDQSWKTADSLVLEREFRPYSGRVGNGSAAVVKCKLGPIDGELLLINYEDGKLGFRLDLTNKTTQPLVLGPYAPLMTHPDEGDFRLAGEPAEWRVYVDSGACGGKCASYGLNENEGQNVAGAVSVLWSPAASQSVTIGQVEVERSWTRIAYLFGGKGINTHEYRWAQAKRLHLRLEQDATGYRIDPGETLQLDQCLVVFSPDPFKALTAFRDAMVHFNQVRTFTKDDVWVGWMSWYNQEAHLRGGFGSLGETSASAAVTYEEARFIVNKGLKAYGIRDVAMDDGYEKNLHLGEWLESTPMFPTGMKGLSRDLEALGLRPGVWLTPFIATEDSPVYREHPQWFVKYSFDWYMNDQPVKAYEFDPTAPGALDWLLNVFRTFQSWGYRLYKNDFSGGLISSEGKQYYNRKQTGLMRWRWTWKKIKEALGGDGACSIQFCGANNIGGLGIVDTVRTGSDVVPCVGDAQWKIIREDTATTAINRWWQNKHFFISDPDNLEVAEYRSYRLYRDVVDFESKWALSFDEARVRATLVVAAGGNIMLGDRLSLLEPERIAIIKKTLPLYGQSAIPLDMFEQTIPSLWWHHVSMPWGSWEVLSVVNFGEASLVKEIPLSKLGIRRGQAVVAWELWSGTPHKNIDDDLVRVVVKPHSVKTLRITPIAKDQTALVGSSFHITMGAVEIREVSVEKKGRLNIELFRPAPETGACAFWSAGRQRVIEMPVEAGPAGTKLTID